MALHPLPSAAPPVGFPRMTKPPLRVDSLAWYSADEPQLMGMQFEARDEIVSLRYPHPYGSGFIGVPRSLAPPPDANSDLRAIGAFEFKASFTSELRPEQTPFVSGVYSALENELGCIGEAPTGFGKTTTGCWLIANIGRPTCIVIPKGDLDWKGELLAHTDIPENKISYWQGGTLPDPEAWVVIAMLQSVYRLNHYPKEVYSRFAALIVDETHRVGSEEFSKVLRQFPAMFRLGLSATPERRDGKMDLIHSHIGWRHVVGISDAEKPDYYQIPSPWTEPTGKDGKRIRYDPSRTNQAKRSMMKDQIRNARIAVAAWRAHKAGRRIIIFVEQIKHGEQIKSAIRAMGVPANRVIEYNGATVSELRKNAKACPEGLILIATYKYTSEGTNIPALDTAILAHPILDPRQPVGRILRKWPNKPKPVVLDVWDTECPTLKSIASKRWEYLRKTGAVWKGSFG